MSAEAKADPVRAKSCPWDSGSPCLAPRPVGMVYPKLPEPRAFGYLDKSGVEWAAYDTGQMEAYGRQAYSDGWEAALAQQAGADKPFAYVEPGTFNATDAGDFEVVAAVYPGVYDHYVPVYRTPQPAIPEGALDTSEGAREYVARYFETHLRRHDFRKYITERLAADFACALARHLSAQHNREGV